MSDLPGPLRSEAAAFRVLVWCIVVLAAIALVTVLVRAIA